MREGYTALESLVLVARRSVHDERLACDDSSGLERECAREHRAGVHAGVELAVLAARIDAARQVVEQRRVELAAGEARRRARAGSTQVSRARRPPCDHLARQRVRSGCPTAGNSGSRPVPASRSSR